MNTDNRSPLAPIYDELNKRMLPEVEKALRQLKKLEELIRVSTTEQTPANLALLCELFKKNFPEKVVKKVLTQQFKADIAQSISFENKSDDC